MVITVGLSAHQAVDGGWDACRCCAARTLVSAKYNEMKVLAAAQAPPTKAAAA
jgi:hypothetical protein